jgi:signal transduction histidine kinase/ligand-binding sensor domain-containing protein
MVSIPVKHFIFSVIMLLSISVVGQEFDHRFRHWNASHGLNSTSCLSLARGNDGYLWVGTSTGLHSFNGVRFSKKNSLAGLPEMDGRTGQLHYASDGYLWVGVDGIGVGRYQPLEESDNRQWYSFGTGPGGNWPNASAVRCMLADPIGQLWLGSDNEGLYRLNTANGSRQKILIDSSKVEYWRSVRSLYLLDSNTLAIGFINALVTINIHTGKVFYPEIVVKDGKRQPSYWDIKPWKGDTLVVGADRGVYFLNKKTWELFQYIPKVEPRIWDNFACIKVLPFSENEIWIASERYGLIFLNPSTGQWKSALDGGAGSIVSKRINDLYRDNDGTIWVAHDMGISSYDPSYNQIRNYPLTEAIFFRQYMTATASPSGKIYYPTTNGMGEYRIDNQTVIDRKHQINNLLSRRQHVFWHPRQGVVMVSRTGLWQFDTTTYAYKPIIYITGKSDQKSPLPPMGMDTVIGRTNHVLVDSSGPTERWWIASEEMYKLACFLPEEKRMVYYKCLELTKHSTTYGVELNKFALDGKGGLWISSQSRGLFYLPDPSKDSCINFWSREGGSRYFAFNAVKDLYFDRKANELWATVPGKGLLKIDWQNTDSLHYEVFAENVGLQFRTLLSICPVGNRYFFISSENGIHCFDKEKQSFTALGWSYGMLMNSYYFGFSGYIGGQCYFLSHGYLVSFDPMTLLSQKEYLPALALQVWKNGVRTRISGVGKSLRLDFENRDIIIEPDIIDLRNTDNYKLQYRLIGYDEDWNVAERAPQIAYSKLKGGKYTFECRLLEGNTPIGDIQGFSLKVDTPFYRSGWFYALLLATGLGLLYLWIRNRQQQQLKELEHQNEILRLQAEQNKLVVRERERITADLHDDVGATLSSLRIYGDLADQVWENRPQESRKLIVKISETAKDLIDRMGDIVWSLKPADDQVYNLETRFKNIGQELLGPSNINCTFEIDNDLGEVLEHPELRKNLLLIVKEAFNNIAKYSGAGEVALMLKRESHDLSLRISDNGIGFDADTVKKGHGLQNMARRCAALGGKYELITAPGKGVIITCRFSMATISHIT